MLIFVVKLAGRYNERRTKMPSNLTHSFDC